MVYTAVQAGVPVKELVKQTGKCRQTIYKWCNRIKEFIGTEFDINDFRAPLHGLYAMWLNSVVQNLKACDAPFTIAFGKGVGYLQEKHEIKHDGLGDRSTDDIVADLTELGLAVSSESLEGDREDQRTQTPS